jgi:hypothetical protein
MLCRRLQWKLNKDFQATLRTVFGMDTTALGFDKLPGDCQP